jgi:hypothetical protein
MALTPQEAAVEREELELRAILTALPSLAENAAFRAILADAQIRSNAFAQSHAHADLAQYALGYIAAVNDIISSPDTFKIRAEQFQQYKADAPTAQNAPENHGMPQAI